MMKVICKPFAGCVVISKLSKNPKGGGWVETLEAFQRTPPLQVEFYAN